MPKKKKALPRPTAERADVDRLYDLLPRMARAAERLLPAYDAAEMPPWLMPALMDLTTMTIECTMLRARLRHPAAGDPMPMLEQIYADLGRRFGTDKIPQPPAAIRIPAPSAN
jgi:hypothetical protein